MSLKITSLNNGKKKDREGYPCTNPSAALHAGSGREEGNVQKRESVKQGELTSTVWKHSLSLDSSIVQITISGKKAAYSFYPALGIMLICAATAELSCARVTIRHTPQSCSRDSLVAASTKSLNSVLCSAYFTASSAHAAAKIEYELHRKFDLQTIAAFFLIFRRKNSPRSQVFAAILLCWLFWNSQKVAL